MKKTRKSQLSRKLIFVVTVFILLFLVLPGLAKKDNSQDGKRLVVKSLNVEDGTVIQKVLSSNAQIVQTCAKDNIVNSTVLDIEESGYIVKFKQDPIAKRIKKLLKQKVSKHSAEFKNALSDYTSQISIYHGKLNTDIMRIERQINKSGTVKIKANYRYVFHGTALTASLEVINRIKNLDYVDRIYPDKEVQADLSQSVPLINADDVWNLGYTGNGIRVGIIDTGIDYHHPDLGGGFGPGYKVIDGYDFVNEDNDPMDDNSHGTHVAGIVAANGVLKGVAPDALLVAYKALNSGGYGNESNIIMAIERSCDPDQDPLTDDALDIINLSLGGQGDPDDPMSQAIDNAFDSGVICVAAAGNRYNYFSINSPGCARNAITVGATDKYDGIASYSSKGPSSKLYAIKPDLVAPGSSIYSPVLSNGFGYKSGTSMAAPHVSGAAALLLQVHPDWSPQMIKNALMQSSIDLGQNVFVQGTGRLDVLEAINVDTIVSPATISLGLDDISQPMFTSTVPVQITNIGSLQKDYNVSISIDVPAGLTTLVSPSNFTLNPGETITVDFDVTVNNSIVQNVNEEPYAYEGTMIINSDAAETIDVPFAFLKAPEMHIVFDESPYYFMIHNRVGRTWVYSYPGDSLDVLLPEGVYDLVVMYADSQTTVIKEGVIASDTVIVNKTDAQNTIEIVAKDENDQTILANSGMSVLHHKPSEITIYTSGGMRSQLFFSNVSTDYVWEWCARSYEYMTKVYHYNGYSNGFSSDITFQNSPSELHHLTYKYHIPPDVNEIFPIHYIATNPFKSIIIAYSYYNVYDDPLSNPYEQDAYYMKLPYDDFSTGFSYKHTYKYLGAPFNPYNTDLLYKSAYMAVENDSTIRAYLAHDDTPIFESSSDNINIGLSPQYWFGRFWNTTSAINLRSPIGKLVWLYLSQIGDLRPHNNIPYELYQDDTLVNSGLLSGTGQPGYGPFSVTLLVTPGAYTLRIPCDFYYINGTQGNALMSATFDTTHSVDRNPPYITRFNIKSNDMMTDSIEEGQIADVVCKIFDDFALNQVQMYYRTDVDWLPLTVSNTDDEYSAMLPSAIPGDTYLSLMVLIDDAYGNILEYKMEPALYIYPKENLPPVLDPIGNKTVNEGELLEFTISATDPDGDGLSFSADNLPTGAVFDPVTRLFTWTPTYTQAGEYPNVRFEVSDTLLMDEEYITITVVNINLPPEANAGGPKTGLVGESIIFDGSASFDPDGEIVNYEWNFGDGSPISTGMIVTHNYQAANNYTVTLTVIDDQGAADNDAVIVTISNPTPHELFSDSFEIGEWNGLWIEDRQNDWFRSSQRSTDGSYSAEIDGYAYNAQLISVPIDLQGHTDITVSFSWLIERGFDINEYLAFDISVNGGSTWIKEARLRGNEDTENMWHNETINLTLTGVTNLMLRFRGKVSQRNEDANVDKVKVIAFD